MAVPGCKGAVLAVPCCIPGNHVRGPPMVEGWWGSLAMGPVAFTRAASRLAWAFARASAAAVSGTGGAPGMGTTVHCSCKKEAWFEPAGNPKLMVPVQSAGKGGRVTMCPMSSSPKSGCAHVV